jgi:hypothetical protein
MSAFSGLYVSRARRWRWLRTALFDPYRPEQHYMRGPGPRWREKHGAERSSGQRLACSTNGFWAASHGQGPAGKTLRFTTRSRLYLQRALVRNLERS